MTTPRLTFQPNTNFASPTTVLQRLGLVAFWSGRAIAWMLWGGALYLRVTTDFEYEENWVFPIILFVCGILAWLAGRAVLFILAAR